MVTQATLAKVISQYKAHGNAKKACEDNKAALVKDAADFVAATPGASPIPWAALIQIILSILAALLNPPAPAPTPTPVPAK